MITNLSNCFFTSMLLTVYIKANSPSSDETEFLKCYTIPDITPKKKKKSKKKFTHKCFMFTMSETDIPANLKSYKM